MANEKAAVLTNPKQTDHGRLILGIALGVVAVILWHAFIFTSELHAVPINYVSVFLALTLLTGSGVVLLGGSSAIRWPVRLMQAMFILCMLAFLGALIWWMVVAG